MNEKKQEMLNQAEKLKTEYPNTISSSEYIDDGQDWHINIIDQNDIKAEIKCKTKEVSEFFLCIIDAMSSINLETGANFRLFNDILQFMIKRKLIIDLTPKNIQKIQLAVTLLMSTQSTETNNLL